jgi:hypothetical protein
MSITILGLMFPNEQGLGPLNKSHAYYPDLTFQFFSLLKKFSV